MLTIQPEEIARLTTLPRGWQGLDVGCGRGRHLHGLAHRLGGVWTGLDIDADDVDAAKGGAAFVGLSDRVHLTRGDAAQLPFADGQFRVTICSEVLEHIPASAPFMEEIVRVTDAQGLIALSVPRRWPERICWWLSEDYRNTPGGHVRIIQPGQLANEMAAFGWQQRRHHHAHGLHSPYWWLKCAVGPEKDDHGLVKSYHGLLEKEMMEAPAWLTVLDAGLNPIMGKSAVHYFTKGDGAR